MKIANNIIGNILGKPRKRGGRNDWDGDGVPNKKDCQPRNTMRQDAISSVDSLGDAQIYVANLKSRVAKDNAIRYFIDKFGWYL